jgi:Uncharacterized enzyme involved in pigment biosynthesis
MIVIDIALIKNNAALGAKIAVELYRILVSSQPYPSQNYTSDPW